MLKTNYESNACLLLETDLRWLLWRLGALSMQPKIPVISVGTSNGTDLFGLVRPEYSGPALKVVHCDRSGHFGRSDRNGPYNCQNCCPQYRCFLSCLRDQVVSKGK